MVEFIKNMFADERGSISHKRFLSTIGSFVLFGVFIVKQDTYLAYLIFTLICLWGSLATIDKFKNL
jgi:hypothetical protein